MPKPLPIAWIAWDTPERIAAHPAIKDGLGQDEPRLMFITFANGALKISATRRPRLYLAESARYARAIQTWIEGALVSEPDRHLNKVAETLRKRLQLEGRRNLGNGVFEAMQIENALAVLAGIRDIAEPPQPPVKEPAIPAFLRKENSEMQENSVGALPALVIASTPIRQDAEGRYCLNDLHKAAGEENKHRPKYWLENQQTQELIEQLRAEITEGGNPPSEKNQSLIEPIRTIKGGNDIQGTYVCKELVYAYAMWISPKFHLTVIRAFDALVSGRKPEVGAAGVHPEIARAARSTAWRIAEEMRHLYLAAMGPSAKPEDHERSWEAFSIQMERIEERLLAKGREMLRKNSPQAVANWMLSWRPEGWIRNFDWRLH